MAIKSKELCRRIRLHDGDITYHVVSKDGTLMQVGESTYKDIEAGAIRSDTFYSKNDRQFQRAFKTVYF